MEKNKNNEMPDILKVKKFKWENGFNSLNIIRSSHSSDEGLSAGSG